MEFFVTFIAVLALLGAGALLHAAWIKRQDENYSNDDSNNYRGVSISERADQTL